MEATLSSKAAELVRQQLDRLSHLRGVGPEPLVYYQWADETSNILYEALGPDHPATRAFVRAVGERGRTPYQRGVADNMSLGIYGPWGILARLNRGEAALRELLGLPPVEPQPTTHPHVTP